MTRADEIVRARLEAERARAAEAKEQAGHAEIEELRAKLEDGIPRLLAALERHDYPQATLVDLSVPRAGLLRPRHSVVQVAAWKVFDERKLGGTHTSVHVLSDGRIMTSQHGGQSSSSSVHSMDDMTLHTWSAEGLLFWLRAAWQGVACFLRRYP